MNNQYTNAPQIDIGKILKRFWSFKIYYVFTVVIFLGFAYIKNKTADRIYQNSSRLLIKGNAPAAFLQSNDLMDGINLLGDNAKIDDEIMMINSFDLVSSTLQRLDFKVSYYSRESIFPILKNKLKIANELYKSSPIEVTLDATLPQLIDHEYKIEFINDSRYRLKIYSEGGALFNYMENKVVDYSGAVHIDTVIAFNKKVSHPYFSFIVRKTEHFNPGFTALKELYFIPHHLEYLTLGYQGALGVERLSPEGSLLNINITGTN